MITVPTSLPNPDPWTLTMVSGFAVGHPVRECAVESVLASSVHESEEMAVTTGIFSGTTFRTVAIRQVCAIH